MAGAMRGSTLTGTSKWVTQAINSGPIKKFLANDGDVKVASQSHGVCTSTNYAIANEIENRLSQLQYAWVTTQADIL